MIAMAFRFWLPGIALTVFAERKVRARMAFEGAGLEEGQICANVSVAKRKTLAFKELETS